MSVPVGRHTDRETRRQADRQAGRQTSRQAGRQIDRQTGRAGRAGKTEEGAKQTDRKSSNGQHKLIFGCVVKRLG